jgi:hypothetical protein
MPAQAGIQVRPVEDTQKTGFGLWPEWRIEKSPTS